MQIFQNGSSIIPGNPAIPSSPVRQLYGKKTMPGGKVLLIAPLDIIFMQIDNSTGDEIFAPPVSTGTLISYQIATPSGRSVGTIRDYDYSLGLLNVTPVVSIDPSPTFDLTNIPEVKASAVPALRAGDPVTLVDSSNTVLRTGTLVSTTTSQFSYPDGNSQVDAFEIDFSSTLLAQVHGARVLVGGNLLGMFINTIGKVSLVFPADRI